MRRFAIVTAVLVGALVGLTARGGTTAFTPVEPTVADTVRVTYDTNAPGAAFGASEPEIFVVVTEFSYDDESRSRAVAMTKDGTVFRANVSMSETTVALDLKFVTRWAYDRPAYLPIVIRTRDGSYPKGALLLKGQRPLTMECEGERCGYDDDFDKELELHPDSWAAYPARWAIDQMTKKASFEKILRKSVQQLPQEKPNETVDLVHARFEAALTLGPPEKTEALMLDLIRRFPRAEETGRAYLGLLRASMMHGPGAPAQEKIDAAMRDAIRSAPEGSLARTVAQTGVLGEDTPIETVNAICAAWTAREPGSPEPLLTLAHAYDHAKTNTVEALALVQKALGFMFSGEARLAGDVNGYYLKRSLPEAYAVEASLLLASKDLPGAYAAAKAAAAGLRPDDPTSDILQGKVWLATGDLGQAEKAFAAGLSKGTGDEARGALKDLYVLRNGGEEGFEDHLKALIVELKPKGGENVAVLPNKTIKTLNGKTIELAKLRGKIVVLNFFSLGCGPCIAEIPSLNKLVDDFKGNTDVVFLAPAGDDPKNLRAFVKKQPFNYQIVPADGTLIPAFHIEAWPTHIIIGRDGDVIARVAGAGDSVPPALKKKIDEQR